MKNRFLAAGVGYMYGLYAHPPEVNVGATGSVAHYQA